MAALLLAAACTQSRDPAPGDAPQGEAGSFEGSWSAAGIKRTLTLGPGHEAAVFDLNGSVVLSGERRPAVGFRARVIGFSDDRATMLGRSVWTDERGDQVFSDLRGDTKVTGNRIFGTIRGGTGRYAGVTGDYSFEWKYMVESGDGAVSGRATTSRARYGWRADAPRGTGRSMNAAVTSPRSLLKKAVPFALVLGLWFTPVPAGLTLEAWHLFAIFASAIVAVILNAFPLLTSAVLAVAAAVLSGTLDPVKAFRRLCELERAAGRRRFPRCECGRQMRARAAHQSPGGPGIRAHHARPGLQHFPDRRPDRSGVSQQYRARRRALSDRARPRPGRRLGADRRQDAPIGWIPHVLRYLEPGRLVGPVAHRHFGQSDRSIARRTLWRDDQLRFMDSSPRPFPC